MTGIDVAAGRDEGRDRMVLDLLLRLPPGLTPGSVWDVGCGEGEYAAMLARRFPGAVLHGLETNEGLLARARRRPGVDWRQGGADAVETGAGLVFSSRLANLAEALPMLAQRLAPGGVLAVIGGAGEDLAACHAALERLCSQIDVWRSDYLLASELDAPRQVGGVFSVAVR